MDEHGVTIFNVGMPILDGTYDHSFDRAGDYAVACNVHQEMAALIVVTSTPFATVADRDGHFTFSGVPHGPTTWWCDEGATESPSDRD